MKFKRLVAPIRQQPAPGFMNITPLSTYIYSNQEKLEESDVSTKKTRKSRIHESKVPTSDIDTSIFGEN